MQEKSVRIHLLPAKKEPIVVVVLESPRRTFHILRWNTESGELNQGSWFRGLLYPAASDISFDGEYMIYCANNPSRRESWTGICKPPFLKAHLDWPTDSDGFGGGVFTSEQQIELASRPQVFAMRGARGRLARGEKDRDSWQEVPFDCHISRFGEASNWDITFTRFARDGFERRGPLPRYGREMQAENGWFLRPTTDHPELRVRLDDGEYTFDLPELPRFLDSKVQWANFDATGNLVVARDGCLRLYRLEDIRSGEPSQEIDLRSMEPPRYQGPPPPPKIVVGPMEDLDVDMLVLPAKVVPWVQRVHEKAGPSFVREVCRLGEYAEIVRGYDLPQKFVRIVHDPLPFASTEGLRRNADYALEGKIHIWRSIALTPVGLTTGWPEAVALRETYLAAVEAIGHYSREVFIVAEDELTAMRYSKIVQSWQE